MKITVNIEKYNTINVLAKCQTNKHNLLLHVTRLLCVSLYVNMKHLSIKISFAQNNKATIIEIFQNSKWHQLE